MKVTTITYQRVLNLGDYNSARLEKTALADEFVDHHEEATQRLIESVERQIHDNTIHKQIDQEIRTREKQLADLKVKHEALKADYQALHKQFEVLKAQQTNSEESDVDDILLKLAVARHCAE